MAPQYFVQGLFALAGVMSILASVLNWEWFFAAQNTRFIVHTLGRKRARIFYGVLGVVLIALAVYFFSHTPREMSAG